MDEKLRQVAAGAGMNEDVVNKLDQILAGPNDRAYVVCSYQECTLNIVGRCTIFTVLDVPKMKRDQPCHRYDVPLQGG